MIVISVTLEVPTEKLEEFRSAGKALVAASRTEPGVVAYHFAEDLLRPGLFRIFEIYANQAALDAHHNSSHFKSWRPATSSFRRSERWLFEVDAPVT